MKSIGLLVLTLSTVPALAADPVHSIESDEPIALHDYDWGVTWSSFIEGNSVSSWQEDTPQAFSHVRAVPDKKAEYEFKLVEVTYSDHEEIKGLFDIYRNGTIVCDDCVGKAYGLSLAPGNYFKVYVGTPSGYAENWHYRGYISHRFDY